jgi:hypothetical protein
MLVFLKYYFLSVKTIFFDQRPLIAFRLTGAGISSNRQKQTGMGSYKGVFAKNGQDQMI